MTNEKVLETLQVWQKALDFAVTICRDVSPGFPPAEKWALAAQLRRSVQSIPANTAEGYGRFYYQDSVRFCYMARGSLEETFSHLTLAYRLAYIDDATCTRVQQQMTELRKMINGDIAFLKQSKRGAMEPGASLTAREDPAEYDIGVQPHESEQSPYETPAA